MPKPPIKQLARQFARLSSATSHSAKPILRATNRTAFRATNLLEKLNVLSPRQADKVRASIIIQDLNDKGKSLSPALVPSLATTRRVKQQAKKVNLYAFDDRREKYLPVSSRELKQSFRGRVPQGDERSFERAYWNAQSVENKLGRLYANARRKALIGTAIATGLGAGAMMLGRKKSSSEK